MKKIYLIFTFFITTLWVHAQTEYKIESFETSLVTKKMLYDWFGKWDIVLRTEDGGLLLVWNNRKLINEANETFTLLASSYENNEELYGVVQVLTSKQQDALAFDSPFKEYLKEFLKTVSRKENKNKRFYRDYQKVEDNFK